MPVTITVSQVRDALYLADRTAGGGAEGSATSALLGQ